MIIINLYEEDETGLLNKFSIEKNHVCKKNGNDRLFSVISLLAKATICALESRFRVELQEHEGFISCMIIKPDIASNLLTKAFRESVKIISEQNIEHVKWHLYSM